MIVHCYDGTRLVAFNPISQWLMHHIPYWIIPAGGVQMIRIGQLVVPSIMLRRK